MQEFATCKVPFFAGTEPKLFPLKREISKIILVMKLTAALMLIATLQVSAKGWTQEKINLSVKNVPLGEVFNSITNQTGFAFFYRPEIVKGKIATISVTNASLQTVLEICLKDQQLNYRIIGKTVVIKPVQTDEKKDEFLNGTTLSNVSSATVDITGRVTDPQGEPISGANVVIKRTGLGTVTNENGQFSLKSVNNDDVLIISYIGYTPMSIKVADKTTFLLVLHIAFNKLDEAVVQGYGTTTQRLATGNISKVTSKEIEVQPLMNPIQAIQGLAPGVLVNNTSGFASGAVKIEIRGRNTINPNIPSDPLYIIDGVPLTILDLTNNGSSSYSSGSQGFIQSGLNSPANGLSPFFSINPADIASIEILKDADATAIYGSRGSNGVILITTKQGRAGKTKYDLSVNRGYSSIIRKYKMLNTQQYVAMRKEALNNDNIPIDVNNAADLVSWDTTRYTNWEGYLWGGVGKVIDVQGNASGGNERTSFRISTGYHYQTDILTSSGANKKATVLINLNNKSADQRFAIGVKAFYSYTSSDMLYLPSAAISLPPNAPSVYNNKGELNYKGWGALSYLYPFEFFNEPYNSTNNFLNSNFTISYALLKGLTVKSDFGYNNFQTAQTFTTPISAQDPSYSPTGRAQFGNSVGHNVIIEPQMNYDRHIGKGKMAILFGASYQYTKSNSTVLIGNGYLNDALLGSIANAPSQFAQDHSGEYKYAALFSRINYIWEDKFIINLNGRRDGSSRFGPGRQYGNFGSIGLGWIFSEEKFFKRNLNFLSFGKLRSSYGSTGGDQIGDYSYLSRWGFSTQTYNGNQTLMSQGHTDSLLQWQVNKKLEIALNLGFANDRVSVEIAWYRDRCNNQLIDFPTPAFTGFTSVTANSLANVENKGLEFTINAKVFDTKAFQWSTKLLLSSNHNKLISYPNLAQSPYSSLYVVGEPLNILRLLHSTGVEPSTGLYSFYDYNKDGAITIDYTGKTPDDRYNLNLNPKYDGSLSNSFNYKNLELGFTFYFRKQKGRNSLIALDYPGGMANQPTNVLKRWQKPGEITDVAKFTTDPYSDISYRYFKTRSDGTYTDASFIRLQNIYASINITPKNKSFLVNGLRVYLQAENLFIITRYKGIDPEVQNFGSLPRPRTIEAGISCNL